MRTVHSSVMQSSHLNRVDYDSAKRELTIEFVGGQRRIYQRVSDGVYQALIRAPSPGAFFWKHIRNCCESALVEER